MSKSHPSAERKMRVAMIVANGITSDSRVKKTAAVVSALDVDLLVLGQTATSPKAGYIGNIPVKWVQRRRFLSSRIGRNEQSRGSVADLMNMALHPVRRGGGIWLWPASSRMRDDNAFKYSLAMSRYRLRTADEAVNRHVSDLSAAGRRRGPVGRVMGWVRRGGVRARKLYIRAGKRRARMARDFALRDRAQETIRSRTRLAEAQLAELELAFGPALTEFQPDVIHVHDYHLLGVAARYKWRRGIKGHDVRIIYDAHEYFRSYAEVGKTGGIGALRHERQYMSAVDQVITVSPMIASWLVRDYGLDRRLLRVALNTPSRGAALASSHALTVRQELGLPQDIPLVVYAGIPTRRRGIVDLIRAAGTLKHVHFVLVCHPGQGAVFHEMAHRWGYGDRIHVLPYVAPEAVTHYLSDCDVGVHPMRLTVRSPAGSMVANANFIAALPNKLFDYLHARLPVVVSNGTAMSELVSEHGVGMVFQPGNIEDLATVLGEALAQKEVLKAGITQELLDRYSWETNIGVLGSVYRDISDGYFPGIDHERAARQLSNVTLTK